jgi:hypothetical protein
MMKIKGKTVVELAADLAAGVITEDLIKDQLGEGVLNSVLALAGGSVVGVGVSKLLDVLDEETGIVSDLGGVVDDVLGLFD